MNVRAFAIIFAMSLLACPSIGFADDAGGDEAKKKSRWSRSTKDEEGFGGLEYEIDKRTGRKLMIARDEVVAERYVEAEAALDRIRMRNLNPLERAQVYRLRAYIAYGRDDYAGAREYLEKTIAEGVLSRPDVAALRFQVAQLWFQEEAWEQGAANLETWFTLEPNPRRSAYYMLALAYYQLNDIEKALPAAQKAVEMGPDAQEGWLQLLLALRLTRQDYTESIPIIEELVRRFPKKRYWLSLSTVHGALGNYKGSLTPLQLAYAQGLLTANSELMRLAQLLLFLDLPYRAALVLQKGLDEGTIDDDVAAWEMLSNSWINAREYEKATAPLERAAEISDDGALYIRLAQVYIQREEWKAATNAIERGLDKGLEEPGEALLLMGIALHSQKRFESARRWFARARKHGSSRAEAETWLKYIDRGQAAS